MTIFEKVERWTFDEALPFWASCGVDHDSGAFIEALDADGRDAGLDYRRARVAGRQIYVFSHAALLGFKPGQDIARSGLGYLMDRFFIDEKQGFARRLDLQGEVIDATPDLYDYAFILFSMSWAYRALGDEQIVEWMHQTADLIERHLSHASGEGYWHDATQEGWRQQNPHMHLLEAALAAVEATDDNRFKAMAERTARLFGDRIFDRDRGVLPEFFDENWVPAPGADGAFVEPGHQFEWAWILSNLKRLTGLDMTDDARALVAFGERHGVNPKNYATYNQVSFDGTPVDGGSRLWPNTERIKSAVAMFEIDGTDPMPVFEQSAGLLMTRYLDREPAGLWTERLGPDGASLEGVSPASTLYHIFLAFTEMLRIRPEIEKISTP